MSWQATAWAINQSDIDDPLMKFVLLCMANYASEDGKNSFPSVSTLAEHTALSESTVRRKIQELEERHFIARGNQAIAVAYIEHAGRRPVVYDLNLTRGVTVTPLKPVGVSKEGGRGVTGTREGCQSLTPNPREILPKQEKTIYNPTWEERHRQYQDGLAALRQQKKV